MARSQVCLTRVGAKRLCRCPPDDAAGVALEIVRFVGGNAAAKSSGDEQGPSVCSRGRRDAELMQVVHQVSPVDGDKLDLPKRASASFKIENAGRTHRDRLTLPLK
jgi:hypothetical protein